MTSATDYEIAELGKRFGLSHTTTRHILDTLESEGWAPPGTYVRPEGGTFYNQDEEPTGEDISDLRDTPVPENDFLRPPL